MVLKKLILKGFKSFPDKTEINFGHGITAIVGPNGSGKSNIVDAIRWVFGEQSAKTLRGGKMDDVIFGGTKEKSAQSFAEVTLAVDNSDRSLAIGYDEVAITRRIYRSGEGEYFINQGSVRLKDVVELFMNTGLGKDGYSIISQGRITEIISQKSQERRSVFEEAAGISKYRYRKEESEKKLRGTEENLVRLRDIFGELAERVEPLRVQSEKAKRYLGLYDEKKNLDINLWLCGLTGIRERAEKLQSAAFLAHTNLETAERDIGALETQIDRLFELSSQKNAEMDATLERVRSMERENADRQSESAVLDNERKHHLEQAERLKNTLEQSKEQEAQLDRERASKETEIAALERRRGETEDRLSALTLRAKDAVSGLSELDRTIEELRAGLAAAVGEITELRITLMSRETEKNAVEGRRNELAEQGAQSRGEAEQFRGEARRLEEELAACDQGLAACDNILEGYRRKAEARLAKVAQKKELWERSAGELSSKLQRLATLRDMEKQMDGYSGSVKKVMQEAERGRLQHIHGPLSKLLRTSRDYTVAIETALGFALQNIVVDSENDAKNAMALLKRENAGRATFMPISAMRGGLLQEQNLNRFAGFVDLAVNLVTAEGQYRGILENLLGRVAVARDIDSAIAIARGCNYKFRIVTLDGQVVNAGGSFTGGSMVKSAGFLSRAGAIEALEQESTELKTRCAKEEADFGESQKELAVLESDRAIELGKKETVQTRQSALSQELSGVMIRLQGAQEALEKAESRQETCAKAAAELALAIAQLQEKLAVQEGRKIGLDGEMQALTETHQAERARNEALLEAVAALRTELAVADKDREAAAEQIGQIEERRRLCRTEEGARRGELAAEADLAEELRKTMLAKTEEHKAKERAIGDSREQVRRMAEERDKADGASAVKRQELKEKNSHKEQLIKEYERLSTGEASLQSEYDGLVSKLYDEYELTYSEALLKQDPAFEQASFQKRANAVKKELKELGNVNVDAIEDYKNVRERYEFYGTQIGDLDAARESLEQFIVEITGQMRDIFAENFAVINEKFQEVFQELFGGGTACLELTDPGDILESGIEIKAAPPGKIIKSLSVLSGGEQAFVAIALYFGIMRVRPVPFCVLDEIEAALDEVNVARFAKFLQDDATDAQFIVITHRRGTMEAADMLYGVTMQEHGVSRMLGLNVSEVEKKLKMKL